MVSASVIVVKRNNDRLPYKFSVSLIVRYSLLAHEHIENRFEPSSVLKISEISARMVHVPSNTRLVELARSNHHDQLSLANETRRTLSTLTYCGIEGFGSQYI